MDPELLERLANFSRTFNDLSEQFIKFSLAADSLTRKLDELAENNPTLFNH